MRCHLILAEVCLSITANGVESCAMSLSEFSAEILSHQPMADDKAVHGGRR